MGAVGRSRKEFERRPWGRISSSSALLGRPEGVRVIGGLRNSCRRVGVQNASFKVCPCQWAACPEGWVCRHRSAVVPAATMAHREEQRDPWRLCTLRLVALVPGKANLRRATAGPLPKPNPSPVPGKRDGVKPGMRTVPLVRRRGGHGCWTYWGQKRDAGEPGVEYRELAVESRPCATGPVMDFGDEQERRTGYGSTGCEVFDACGPDGVRRWVLLAVKSRARSGIRLSVRG